MKLYGSMICEDDKGNKVVWVWDYANDKARLQKEMTKDKITASEKAKWMGVKSDIQST